MEITKIECTPIRLPILHYCQGDFPIQGGIRMSYGTLPKALPVVIVQLHTSDGLIGVGDAGAVTSLTYMPDTPAGIVDALTEWFAPIILGEDPFKIDKIMATLDRRAIGNYLAKTAIDFALHDIVGKALNVPVYQLIGGLTTDRIALSWVMSAGRGDEMVREALGALEAGYRSFKIKVGLGPLEEDIKNIEAIRSAVGDDIPVGIDANAGWELNQAMRILKKLEKYDICVAEQPTRYWDIEGLATLRRALNIPIMADESCCGFGEIMHLIKMDAVDQFLMKINHLGGIWKAKMIASLAKAAGIPVIVGEKLGGGITVAAAAHFAFSTDWVTSSGTEQGQQFGPGLTLIHGTYELGPAIKDDVVKEVPKVQGGYIYPPKGPGLGVELNFEMIEKYRSGPTVVKTKGS